MHFNFAHNNRNKGKEFDGCFDGYSNNLLRGWVFDKGDIDSPATVAVIVNGEQYGDFRSNLFREDLLRAGKGKEGYCAFEIPFDATAIMAKEKVDAITVEIFIRGRRNLLLGRQCLPNGVPQGFPVSSQPFYRSLPTKLMLTVKSIREIQWLRTSSGHSTLLPSISTDATPSEDRVFRSLEERLRATAAHHKTDLKYRVVGHIDGHYSLSIVNRGIALSLRKIFQDVCSVYHVHGHPIDGTLNAVPPSELESLSEMLTRWDDEEADADQRISICHHYPPIEDPHPARLRLAIFFWEESLVPVELVAHFNLKFDGLLVASHFVRKVLRFSGCTLPIKVVPMGVDHILDTEADALLPDSGRSVGQPFRFLHISSCFARKGVDVLLTAYFEEFSSADSVELYVKTFPNPHNDVRSQIDRLQKSHSNPPRVVVDENFINETELVALYRSSQAVVLPTRGEGFNLPAAEAMAVRRAVIATGYGAHTDFLTDETGWSIEYALSPAEGHLSVSDSFWAEPNVSHLRRLLRGFFKFDGGRGTFADAELKLEKKSYQRLLNEGLLRIRKNYRWSHAAVAIDAFAHELLKLQEQRARRPRVAWISSWNTRCGIAEYSKHFVDRLNKMFEIVHICDRRTQPEDNVYPLYDVDPLESFVDVHAFLQEQSFDAVVVQHQPTFWDISGEVIARLADIQERCPVFLFFHSTRFLLSLSDDALGSAARFLARLEGVFVHTLEDVNLLKNIGVIANVGLLPHGVETPNDLDEQLLASGNRDAIAEELVRLDARGLSERSAVLVQSLRKGEFWIGTFGFLLPHKRNKELLRALYLLHNAGLTGVRLLFICAALDERSRQEKDELIEMAQKLGLSDDVAIVTEFLPIDQCTRFLAAADLLVFAYQGTSESASGAIRVALSTGRPALTTPEPIFESLASVLHKSPGWSAEEIAEVIVSLIRDPKALKSTEEARRTWLQLYSYSRLAERLANILNGSIADFRLKLVDVTRNNALTRGSISNDLSPLCPPGIRYPEQGATREWQKKLFILDTDVDNLAFALTGDKPNSLVRWNADCLWLETSDSVAETVPLHLHPTFRHCLDQSLLVLSESARRKLSPNQVVSLFLYARHQNLRIVLFMNVPDRSPFAENMMLADLLLFDNMADKEAWLRAAKSGTRRRRRLGNSPFPQLHILDLSSGSWMLESASLRALAVYWNGHSNPLLDVLRRHATQLNALAGHEVLRFHSLGESIPLVDGGLGQAIFLIETAEGLDYRSPIAPAADEMSTHSIGIVAPQLWSKLQDVRSVRSFMAVAEKLDILIFTSSTDYRRTLAKICMHCENIALTRRKCVLLEQCADETDEEFIERFARVLRLRKPLPIATILKTFPRLSAPPFEKGTKKLSVCVSTYNRAHWLRVTIPLLASDLRRYRQRVEFIVVDNASTDDTEIVMLDLAARFDIAYYRNPKNVGMLGNLAVTAQRASGDYVWILGDDDLVKPGTTAKILNVIKRYPRTELIYMNYSYTHFDSPDDLQDIEGLMQNATHIAQPTPSGFYEEIREFAPYNENFFTAIYTCIFRRDHALGAYCQFTDDPPFSSMRSCIPTTHYVLEKLFDRPGYWIGSSQLVVNMNVSWMRYAPIWHMERFVEIFDRVEQLGVPAEKLLRYRRTNIRQALHFLPIIFDNKDFYVANIVSMQRYIESMKGVDEFNDVANDLLRVYELRRRESGLFARQSLSATSLRLLYGIGRNDMPHQSL